ncbi:MFS transporter [Arthrobacter sp. PsM3]|uniref:MFS transporter n=1 Tax=Arthrobacter sp. PsM3 TaxID=3030531 RepID=UPI00263B4D7C|nr:MFS transporter [Arthrobacter sp. PsM3]MDN4645261.1 MFS transporter [Arthrobacter sp. PsM3]
MIPPESTGLPAAGREPGAPPPRRAADLLRALRVRNFALFWTGQLISGTGTWMQMVAMAWLVLDISGSAAVLGLVTTMQFLPLLMFVLPAGVLADRLPKRRIMLAAQALATVQALLLGFLALAGSPQIWQLAVLAFTLGVSNAFNNPAQQAFVPEMVGPTLVPDAVAMNSVQFNSSRMIGFALGGLAVAHFSAAAVFFVNAASFAAALGALLALRSGELRVSMARPARHGALREGLRYVLHTPDVLFVLAVLAVVGTFGYNWPVAAPLLARDVLNVESVGFGALMSAFGAGSLVAGVGLVVIGGSNDRRMITSGGVLALILILLGISRSYPVSLGLMVLAGLSGTVFTTTVNTRLQGLAPDRLRGRVMSLFVLLLAGTTPFGSALLGLGAEAFGVSATIIGFGVITVAGLAGLLVFRARKGRAVHRGAVPARRHRGQRRA